MQNKCKAYSSDSLDKEWQLILPYLPLESQMGCPRPHAWCDIIDAIESLS